MKLIIFGPTGNVGSELVRQALDQGHTVTAFVREPSRILVEHRNLTLAQGNALDPASVQKSIQGHDAVLCALGAGRKGRVRSEGTRNIVQAMEASGVRRLICQTTLGLGDSRANLDVFWKHIMFGMLLRTAYNDHVGQEGHVMRSTLDWTIVRPGAFTDGERTGAYRHGFPPDDRTLRLKISLADVADFMLRQLTDLTYLHKTPGLSY